MTAKPIKSLELQYSDPVFIVRIDTESRKREGFYWTRKGLTTLPVTILLKSSFIQVSDSNLCLMNFRKNLLFWAWLKAR